MLRSKSLSIIIYCLLLISFVLQFVSAEQGNEKNLIPNPGFESTVEYGPQGWYWEYNGNNKATIDSDAYEGNNSVKLDKVAGMDNTLVAVRTNMMRIKGNTDYTMSAYVKAYPGTSACLYCNFFDDNNEYIRSSEPAYVKGDTLKWHLIGLIVRTPKKATRFMLRFEIFGADATGIAWIDDVWFSEGIIEARIPKKDVYFSPNGNIFSRVRLTPEFGLQGETGIYMKARVLMGTNPRGSFDFEGLYDDPGYGAPFEKPEYRSFSSGLRVKRLRLTMTGPILTNLPDVDLTLGHTSFEYSPYTINMATDQQRRGPRDDRNQPRKGVLLDDISHPYGSSSAFFVWDVRPTNKVWGGKDTTTIGPLSITSIFVDAKQDLSIKVVSDRVFSSEFDLNHDKMTLNILLARNWKDEAPFKQKTPYSDLVKADLEYRVDFNTALLFTWRDFGYQSSKLKFDPLYRDVHDENIFDNHYEAPLDVYMGYKGYTAGFSHNEGAHYLSVLFENYLDRTVLTSRNNIPAKVRGVVVNGETLLWDIEIKGTLEQRNRVEHYASEQLVDYDMHRFEFRGTKNLKSLSAQNAKLIFRWQEEIWPSITDNNTMMRWTEHELKLESVLPRGPFQGLRWSTYILAELFREKIKKRVGVTAHYVLPYDLSVKVQLAYPNVKETSAMRDQPTPFGRLQMPDNCLELMAEIPF